MSNGQEIDYLLQRKATVLSVGNGVITHKLKEVITWVEHLPKVVCVGFNPAKSNHSVDSSNCKLIECICETFNSRYGGYTLYNLFCDVAKDEKDFNKISNKTPTPNLIDILNDIDDDTPIILFFGAKKISSDYEKIIDKKKVYLTVTKNGSFIHVSRSSGSIKRVNKSNLIKEDFKNGDIKIKKIKKKGYRKIKITKIPRNKILRSKR